MSNSSKAMVLALLPLTTVLVGAQDATSRPAGKPVYFDRFEAPLGAVDMGTFASMLVSLRLESERDVQVIRSPVNLLCDPTANLAESTRPDKPVSSQQKHFLIKGSVTRSALNTQFSLRYSVQQVEDCKPKTPLLDEDSRQFTTAEALWDLSRVADRIASKLAEAASDRIPIRIESKDDVLKTELELAFEDSDTFRPTFSQDAKYIVGTQKTAKGFAFEINGPDHVNEKGTRAVTGNKFAIPAFAEYLVERAENIEARRRIGVTGALENWNDVDLIAKAEQARAAGDNRAVAAVLDARSGLSLRGEELLGDALLAVGKPSKAGEAYDRAITMRGAQASRDVLAKAASAWERVVVTRLRLSAGTQSQHSRRLRAD